MFKIFLLILFIILIFRIKEWFRILLAPELSMEQRRYIEKYTEQETLKQKEVTDKQSS